MEATRRKSQNIVSFPIDLLVDNDKHYVVLAKIPRTNLTDPFFLDSLSGQFKLADVNKIVNEEQTTLVRPLHYDKNDDRIEFMPLEQFIQSFNDKSLNTEQVNFIFHMSRCGSTLATQMLATVDRFYVISESTMVNAVLNPVMTLPRGITKQQVLKSVINCMFACRPDHCERVFIKFRSWNILFIDQILNLYPNVHWMYVHRNGLEVLESVLRDPPGWMRSRHLHAEFFASALGLKGADMQALSDGEYACRLLGTFCKKAVLHEGPMSLSVDYMRVIADLPAILDRNWELHLTDTETHAMLSRREVYSKDPQKTRIFEPDSEKKRQSINRENHKYAEKYIESERQKLKSEFHK